MAGFSNSPLSIRKYPNYLDHMGQDVPYNITIPTTINLNHWYLVDLLSLPIYYRNITCVVDNDKLVKRTKRKDVANYFLVNDHVFCILIRDRYTEQQIHSLAEGTSAIFVSCLRHSLVDVFDRCNVPVYPMPYKSGSHLSLADFENYYEPTEKDISVFFSGRHAVRPSRIGHAKWIITSIPDSVIYFLTEGIEALSSTEYLSYMRRAKIAWCPRSVWALPDKDCNSVTVKEVEAMRCGAMVLKPPIGVKEPAERIQGTHFTEYKNDGSDLLEKINYYLEHDEERKEIAHNGRLWWEKNCTLLARASFYLRSCLKAMGEIESPTQ